jgi:beta-xylosidase
MKLTSNEDTPLKHPYSLEEHPGYLRLYGSGYGLNSPEAPTMLLRKQMSYSECFQARMTFSPSKEGYEAGLVLWWNQFNFACIGLARFRLHDQTSSVLTIKIRRPTGKAGVVEVSDGRPKCGGKSGTDRSRLHIPFSMTKRVIPMGLRPNSQNPSLSGFFWSVGRQATPYHSQALIAGEKWRYPQLI